MPSQELGDSRLPILLKEAKMSKAEFGRRMGMSRQYVHKIIKGERIFSLEQIARAAPMLGCEMNAFYERTWQNRLE